MLIFWLIKPLSPTAYCKLVTVWETGMLVTSTAKKETLCNQQLSARSIGSGTRGVFWNLFRSWPQAAFASNPLVWRTLTVILAASKAPENASTYPIKIFRLNNQNYKDDSSHELNCVLKWTKDKKIIILLS